MKKKALQLKLPRLLQEGMVLQREITAKLYPENAVDTVLFWSVVDDAGIPSNLAQISVNGKHAVVKAKGDGCFRVRCMSRNGTEKIRLISQLDFEVTGIGTAYLLSLIHI